MDDKLKEIASYFRVDSDYCYDCKYLYEDRQDKCLVCMKRKIAKESLGKFKEYVMLNLCCRPHLDFCEADCFHNCSECWRDWWEE